MQIRYTPPNDLEIIASAHELHRVAHGLQRGESGEYLATSGADPAPDQQFLRSVEIVVNESAVEVAVVDGAVVIRGSREALEAMASFFESAADADGGHSHFEWFAGNDYVAASSCPLVISRSGS